MSTTPRKGELPPPVQGFGDDPKRLAAATAAYGEQLSRALPDDAEVLELLDDEPTQPHPIAHESSPTQRAVLEPVSEDAHPADQRRMPTHPELLSDALAAVAAGKLATKPAARPHPPEPAAPELADAEPASTSTPMRVPEPTAHPANRSPSPVRVSMGLFSADRITNLLAGVAIGLVLVIIPAHKLALAHAQTLLTQPLLELSDSIEHPLAVEVGLLAKPQAIAAQIEAGREAVRTRYFMIWLLGGLPLGLGLGLIPRWWA